MRHHHGLPRFADKGARALDGTKAAIDTVLDFQAVVRSMVSIQATTSTASGLRMPQQAYQVDRQLPQKTFVTIISSPRSYVTRGPFLGCAISPFIITELS